MAAGFFQPEIETMPRRQLRSLQNERLRHIVQYVYDRVPFYKKQFDERGISPRDIQSVNDLPKLPFTKKNDLRDHYPFGMFAVPMNEILRIHASSGTTGKPTVVGYTKHDIEIFAEVVARSLIAAGARPGMKLQNAYGYGLFTGGLGLHYGAEKLGMAVIPVSGGMTDRQILILRDFKPEVMSCTPSYALALADEILKRGIDPGKDLALKFMILGAEPWTETIRNDIQNKLGVKATNIYGLSEIIGPGISQEDVDERGSGSSIWEDHFFPEIVDAETGEPMEYGKPGVLVFTTLSKQGMPLLRYWTNDITNLFYEESGKRTHIKMGPIIGRADDMLIIRGVNLFPSQIESVLNELPQFSSHYQLLLTKEGALDSVEVLIELKEEFYQREEPNKIEKFARHRHELADHIKQQTGLSMKVSIVDYGKIRRSEGGKLNRVEDLRKK